MRRLHITISRHLIGRPIIRLAIRTRRKFTPPTFIRRSPRIQPIRCLRRTKLRSSSSSSSSSNNNIAENIHSPSRVSVCRPTCIPHGSVLLGDGDNVSSATRSLPSGTAHHGTVATATNTTTTNTPLPAMMTSFLSCTPSATSPATVPYSPAPALARSAPRAPETSRCVRCPLRRPSCCTTSSRSSRPSCRSHRTAPACTTAAARRTAAEAQSSAPAHSRSSSSSTSTVTRRSRTRRPLSRRCPPTLDRCYCRRPPRQTATMSTHLILLRPTTHTRLEVLAPTTSTDWRPWTPVAALRRRTAPPPPLVVGRCTRQWTFISSGPPRTVYTSR
mmetsp:Transcript_5534/g.16932  ORF Transcript_5534/g.16932 Transcript_5534/m.16932 type:complete len:331 (+) Transcript_5534:1216-2208(+)